MSGLELTVSQILEGNPTVILSIAFLGGLLTAFTPCVYPMIPITMGVLGAKKLDSRKRAVAISLSFVLGLSVIYSALGFFAAVTGKVLGSVAQNPFLISSVSLLFILMGLSLLGLFELQLPSSIQTYLSKIGNRGGGFGGAFVLGSVSGLLAAPCSGPVVVGILAFVAMKANPVYGFLLLFVFSLGLGLPFFFLGTFSQLWQRAPKSGIWLNWSKHFSGLILIGVGFYFFFPLISPANQTALLLASILMLAVFLSKIFPSESGSKKIGYSIARAFLLVVFAYIFAQSEKAQQKLLEASQNPNQKGLTWVTTVPDGIVQAKNSGKLVMIDFWAEWCVACHQLENETFSNPEVLALLKSEFITVKVDATEVSEGVSRLFAKYGVVGLPTIVFLDSEGNFLKEPSFSGFLGPDPFLVKIKALVEEKVKEAGLKIEPAQEKRS